MDCSCDESGKNPRIFIHYGRIKYVRLEEIRIFKEKEDSLVMAVISIDYSVRNLKDPQMVW